jgi:hypothetical protein
MLQAQTEETNTNRNTTTIAVKEQPSPKQNVFYNFKELLRTADEGRTGRNM